MDRFFLTERRLNHIIGFVGLIGLMLGLALSLSLVSPYLPFVIVFALIWMILIFRWPFLGLAGYLMVVLLRPGEALGIPFVAKAAAGSCLLVLLARIIRHKKFPRATMAYKAMLVFAISIFLSSMTAYWFGQVMETSQNIFKVVVLYTLMISFLTTKKQMGALGVLIISAVGYVGLYVIYQFVIGSASLDQRIYDLAWGLFGDSNEFAQIIVMILPVLVMLLIEIKGTIWRVFFSSMVGIYMAVFVLGGSRGGFLGLMAIAMALVWKSSRRTMLAFIVFITIGTAFFLAPKSYFDRLGSIAEYSQDESATGRIEAWKAGFRMFLSNPATGIGAGCFPFALSDYGVDAGIVAHNSFITALSETGLLGFTAYILFLFFTVRGSRRMKENLELLGENRGFMYVLANAFPISVLGYIVTGMFISTIYYPQMFVLSAMASAGEIISGRWVEERTKAVR